MHILDIILGVFLILFLINGIRKGFITGFIHLVGLILAVVIIGSTGNLVKTGLINQFHLSETLALILAYILIFLIIMIIAKITILIVHRVVQFLNLMWLNRLLGAVLGVFNGLLIIALLILGLNLLPFHEQIRGFTDKSSIAYNVRKVVENLESRKKIKEISEPIKEAIDEKIKEQTEQLDEILD